MALATFGMGCFWSPELLFSKVDGVTATAVGYMGGSTEQPTYDDVCSGRTGHAEVVQITYEESKVSYEELLELFWNNHNPTTRNRQGPDVGSQYRSVVFYHDEQQRGLAHATKEEKQKELGKEVVTEISPAKTFWRAEDDHQEYLKRRGQESCSF